MFSLDRRAFLRSSLAGAAALSFGAAIKSESLLAADPPPSDDKAAGDKSANGSLFLTWQQDPTTTMTIQWVGPATAADTQIRYVPRTGDAWKTATTVVKPFPATDLKVHRCELTGLSPGTEYLFQIGNGSRDVSLPHDAGQGHQHHPVRLRRRLRHRRLTPSAPTSWRRSKSRTSR